MYYTQYKKKTFRKPECLLNCNVRGAGSPGSSDPMRIIYDIDQMITRTDSQTCWIDRVIDTFRAWFPPEISRGCTLDTTLSCGSWTRSRRVKPRLTSFVMRPSCSRSCRHLLVNYVCGDLRLTKAKISHRTDLFQLLTRGWSAPAACSDGWVVCLLRQPLAQKLMTQQ